MIKIFKAGELSKIPVFFGGVMKFALLIIYAVIGTVPFIFAAVQPWIWSAYVAAVFMAFVFLLWSNRVSVGLPNSKIFMATVLFFFAVTFFQCLPLPPNILSFLSPFRYELLEKSWVLIDRPVSWQAISYSPLASLAWWTFLLSLLFFFLVLRECFTSRRNLRFTLWVILGAATLESLYGLIQALVPAVGVLWVDWVNMDGARGTFINRNHFAGFMEMVWPLALGYTLSLGDWQRKGNHDGNNWKKRLKAMLSSDRLHHQLVFSLGIVIMILALLFSRSRAGIMGAFVGFLTFVVLSGSGNRRLPLGFWLMFGAIIGLVVIYGLKIGFAPIIERFLELSDGNSRLDFWQDSLTIIKDHPLGIGLGNFKRVFAAYNVSVVSDLTVTYTHNDYLQLLVEAGWPGFLALVSGFFIFLGKSFFKVKRLSPHDDPLAFFMGIGALSGLVSMLFHSFLDFNLQMPANCIYFITLIALVYVCVWERKTLKGRFRGSGFKGSGFFKR
jgi:O-antigen ligase